MSTSKLKLLMVVLLFILAALLIFAIWAKANIPGDHSLPDNNAGSTQMQKPSYNPVIPPASTQKPSDAGTTQPAEEETTEATTEPDTDPTTEATTEATTEPPTVPDTEETTMPETYPDDGTKTIGERVAAVAVAQLGKPYRYGGEGPDDFDASGLVQYCYAQCGIKIGRSTSSQVSSGTEVEMEDIQPGDAVFFWSGEPGKVSYVAVYIGNGQAVVAMNSSKPVLEINIHTAYYTEHFVCIRRYS